MCNRYLIKAKLENIAARFNARLIDDFELGVECLPRSSVPGLLFDKQSKRVLAGLQFAFCPPGCESPGDPKRALNNARVESIHKWPWKDAFRTSRCVVPMTDFREPCYWGETAGSEVYFHRPDHDLLLAAGIYRTWRSPDGESSVVTMSLLMRPAGDYVMSHGHHRQPVFVDEQEVDQWLERRTLETQAGVDLLRSLAIDPELEHTHARDMAPSWTKRQSARMRERDEQLAALETASAVGF
ncbi:hypothetical protein Pla123a_24130 [Posidoniimonas polymericola]|uniref:Abasic site processing protein n=1 Tax=Posidoniimonas polymericola TaxID=2528002 RepID=A0A5C5YQB6_9BACT|nr:SOS response-associated peptidase family protein [Posidoniimonas polymericola]TWT76988.1 hypothetical protein Pla123a_24130 [Posidoniimonas polymericola]